mgnify:CR=1 FL=1
MNAAATQAEAGFWPRFGRALLRWFDAGQASGTDTLPVDAEDRVEWARIVPFIGMHVVCLAVIWVGWSQGMLLLVY